MSLTINPAAQKEAERRAYKEDNGDRGQDAQLLDLLVKSVVFSAHNPLQ